MPDFRKQHPSRRAEIVNGRPHTTYRDDLKRDFNSRCGYTDCRDVWWGVKFQVDHFAPQRPNTGNDAKDRAFTDLERVYSNLVYACPQVNNAKDNLWVTDDPTKPLSDDGLTGLLEPCNDDYNNYFTRTDTGRILAKNGNSIAAFMIDKLKLNLFRYELYWRVDELHECKKRLQSIRRNLAKNNHYRQEVNDLIADLDDEFMRYIEYIGANHNEVV